MEKQENTSGVDNLEKQNNYSDYLVNTRLAGKELAFVLKFFGGFYFLLSFIGGVVLLAKHSNAKDNLFSIGIVGIITSIIVLLICLGISKSIEQNAFIIKYLKSDEDHY